MAVSYTGLFHLMIDKKMTNTEIEEIVTRKQVIRDKITKITAEIEVAYE